MLKEDSFNNLSILENSYNITKSINEYLSFELNQEEYALSILKVKEIIGVKEITPVPNLPKYIKGVINLRGKIINIVDLREKFKIESKEYDKFTVIIIIETDKRTFGILVDSVKDVININMENIQNNFEQTKDIEEKYIHGITNYEDRIICILNIDSLVSE